MCSFWTGWLASFKLSDVLQFMRSSPLNLKNGENCKDMCENQPILILHFHNSLWKFWLAPKWTYMKPGCHKTSPLCSHYNTDGIAASCMMYKCECLLGWWVEDTPQLFCQKTSLLRARKMMIIFISSRVMLEFVYRSLGAKWFFFSLQLMLSLIVEIPTRVFSNQKVIWF